MHIYLKQKKLVDKYANALLGSGGHRSYQAGENWHIQKFGKLKRKKR
jgi:hypothetical protein